MRQGTRFTLFIIFIVLSINTAFASNESSYAEAIVSTALHKADLTSEGQLTILSEKKAKMVVFTDFNNYHISDIMLDRDIWVTAVPDIKNLCATYLKQNKQKNTASHLQIWITKLLGLPIQHAENRRFVELEVPVTQAYYGPHPSKIGIFRPCTDPRVTAHNDKSEICPKYMDQYDKNIPYDYVVWFVNQEIAAHTLHGGYPWTGYGYTYNWNKNKKSAVGVSEFVVLKGTRVKVLPNPNHSTTPYMTAEEYCRK